MSNMESLLPKDIEQYCREKSTPVSAVLDELEAETYARVKDAHMLIGPSEGLFLQLLVKLLGARRVVEIGTFTGYSALVMAEGLPDDGQLITLDIDAEVVKLAHKYWDRSPHGKKIKSLIGPALDSLENIPPPVDLVFIDADKENNLAYWEACLPKLRPGGLIVTDNVLWSGKVLHPVETSDLALAEFNAQVKKDERMDSVILTVRDGLTVSMKK
jgi:caffeoyl-CoA O-methyltransferase